MCFTQRTTYSVSDSVSSTGEVDRNTRPRLTNSGTCPSQAMKTRRHHPKLYITAVSSMSRTGSGDMLFLQAPMPSMPTVPVVCVVKDLRESAGSLIKRSMYDWIDYSLWRMGDWPCKYVQPDQVDRHLQMYQQTVAHPCPTPWIPLRQFQREPPPPPLMVKWI